MQLVWQYSRKNGTEDFIQRITKVNHALIFSEIFLFYLYKLGYNFKGLLSGLVRLITVTNNADRKPEIYSV